MAGTGIMAGICTSPYPIEKVGDSPYPYPYPVNAEIPRQNRDRFGQYPRGRVYLSSIVFSLYFRSKISIWSLCFFYLNLVPIFENSMQLSHFRQRCSNNVKGVSLSVPKFFYLFFDFFDFFNFKKKIKNLSCVKLTLCHVTVTV